MEWLTDNGSCYTANETVEQAYALGMIPCFTPIRSAAFRRPGTPGTHLPPAGIANRLRHRVPVPPIRAARHSTGMERARPRLEAMVGYPLRRIEATSLFPAFRLHTTLTWPAYHYVGCANKSKAQFLPVGRAGMDLSLLQNSPSSVPQSSLNRNCKGEPHCQNHSEAMPLKKLKGA